MTSTGRVILGVSGTLRNTAALHAAATLAVRTGRPLVAVTAWLPPGGEQVARRTPCPELDDTARLRAQDVLREALGEIGAAGPARARAVRGRPGHVLVGMAVEPDDVLVVGTGRRSHLGRLAGGAVTRFCLHHAACPVVAVPPPAMLADLRQARGRRHRTVPPEWVEPSASGSPSSG